MARNRSPIVRKALGLIAASLRPVARARRRPIVRKLLLLGRPQRPIHGYAYYVSDYEFSPPPKKRSRRRFLSLLCGGDDGDELEAQAPDEDDESDLQMLFDEDEDEDEEEEEEEEGDASVDQRAERFIEKFYEEIRNQRSEIALCSFSAD